MSGNPNRVVRHAGRKAHIYRKMCLLPLLPLCLFLFQCFCISPARGQSIRCERENFDRIISYSTTPNSTWDTCGTLCSSSPYSFWGQVPLTDGDSSLLISPYYDFTDCAEVYLVFEHICKISRYDMAEIEYREDFLGARWRPIPRDCYTGLRTAYTLQGFSAASYSEWKEADSSLIPDNQWWKTEVFNLSPILGHSKFQIRFKVKKGGMPDTQFQYGWLLDNIMLCGGQANSLPPVFRFESPVFADAVKEVGPFDVAVKVTGDSVVRWEAFYRSQNQWLPMICRQQSHTDGLFSIPRAVYGSAFAYRVKATDAEGDTFALERSFRTVLPADGRDSDAVEVTLCSPSQPHALAGDTLPLYVHIRNRGIHPLRAIDFVWEYEGVRRYYRWRGHLSADFPLDSLYLGGFRLLESEHRLTLSWQIIREDSLSLPADTLLFDIYGCTGYLHGTYTVGEKNRDFSDLDQLMERLSVCGMDGSCTFLLDSGDYVVHLDLGQVLKWDRDSLVFASLSGRSGDVRLIPDSNAGSILSLRNIQHLICRDLTFETVNNIALAEGCVLLEDSCRQIGFHRCQFILHDNQSRAVTSNGGKYNADWFFTQNRFEGGHTGISLLGRNLHDYSGMEILQNRFIAQHAYGIYLYCTDFQSISQNYFDASTAVAATYYNAVNIFACSGERVSNNRFYLYGGRYACCMTAVTSLTATPLAVENNEIRFSTQQQQSAGFCLGSSCRNITFLHNSVCLWGKAYGTACVWASGLSDSILWHNNLLLHYGTGNAQRIWEFGTPLYLLLSGHRFLSNHYDIPHGGILYTDHSWKLGEWQSLSPRDSESVCQPLSLKDTATDLCIADVSALCLTPAGVTTDLSEVRRNPVITQKGAYHRLGLHAVDAALFRVTLRNSPDGCVVSVCIANVGREGLKKVGIACAYEGKVVSRQVQFPELLQGDTLWLHRWTTLPLSPGNHGVKVYVYQPNDTIDTNPANDTLSREYYHCISPLQGSYVVGENGDFATLAAATEQAQRCGIRGDVHLRLQSGIYTGSLLMEGEIPGSSDSSRLIISSLASCADSVVLVQDSNSTLQGCVTLSRVSHLVFDRITLLGNQASNAAFSISLHLRDSCSDIRVDGCRLAVKPVQASISMYAAVYAAETACQGLVFTNNEFCHGSYGVYLQGRTSVSAIRGVRLQRNRFQGQETYSLYLKRAVFDTISGNHAANFFLQGVQGNLISANRLHAADQPLCLYLEEVSPCYNSLYIVNNEIISQASQKRHGIEVGPYCNRLFFEHNSLCLIGSGEGHCLHLQASPTSYQISFRKNILANYSSSGSSSNCVVYMEGLSATSVFRLDENHYDGKVAGFIEAPVFTLHNWRTVSGQDDQSSMGAIRFLDSSRQLQPVADAPVVCLRQDPVWSDLEGEVRTLLTWKGAYAPRLTATDGLLFRWVSPSASSLTKRRYPVKVVLGNWGEQPISEAVVVWWLNGVKQAEKQWQGALSKGDTAQVYLGDFLADSSLRLTVYIHRVNGLPDPHPSNDTLSVSLTFCDTAMRGDYLIGRDFPDLEQCLARLRWCGVGGNVRILLPAGSYCGPFLLDGVGGDYPVVFTSASGIASEVVFTLPSETQSGQTVISCSQTRNLCFDGISIRIPEQQTEATAFLFRFRNEHLTVENCRIEMCRHSKAAFYQSGEWNLKNLTIRNNQVSGGKWGVCLQGTSAYWDTNVIIRNNRFSGLVEQGFWLRHVLFDEISENELLQESKSSGGFYGIHLEEARGNGICANRVVASRGYYGLYFSSVTPLRESLLVSNNEIRMQVNASNCGIYLYNHCHHLRFYHNSVLLTGNGMGKCLYTPFVLSNISLKNNHLVNLGGNSQSHQSHVLYFYAGNGAAGWEMDYNAYYNAGTLLHYAGGDVSSLAEWRTKSGKEEHSVCCKPTYADREVSLLLSDYDSLSCPLLAEVPCDRTGCERAVHTNMGAYQALPVEATDWEMVSIVSPVVGDHACHSIRQPFCVKVRNRGKDTVWFEHHPLHIGYRFSGAMQAEGSCVIRQGRMAPLQTDTFLLTADCYLLQHGTYCLETHVTDTSDSHPENDTARLSYSLQRTVLPFATNMDSAFAEMTLQRVRGDLDWRLEGATEAVSPVSGSQMLVFPSSRSRGSVARMVLHPMDLSGLRGPRLSIWYAHDGSHKNEKDQIRVLLSTDGGASYRCIYTLYRYQAGVQGRVWTRHDLDLSPYAVPCVCIALEGISYGGDGQYVDSMEIVGDAFVQIESVLTPESVNNCQLNRPDFLAVLSNPTAQPIQLDSVCCTLDGMVDNQPFSHVYVWKGVRLPPYRKDTLSLIGSFWETNRRYQLRMIARSHVPADSSYALADNSHVLADSLLLGFTPSASLSLKRIGLPPCASPGDTVYADILLENNGKLHVRNAPLLLYINDSLYAFDSLPLLRSGDSLRYRFGAFLVPDVPGNSFEINVQSPLECDSSLEDNSCFGTACISVVVEEPTRMASTPLLYPNPTYGECWLLLDLEYPQEILCEIFTVQAQPVSSYRFSGQAGANRLRMTLPSTGSPVFLCRIRCGNQVWIKKVVRR